MGESMTKDIILLSGGFEVLGSQDAASRRNELVKAASYALEVIDATSQQTAVSLMQEIQILRKEVEVSRKTVKAPVLEVGKKIDRIADEYCAPLETEYKRLSAAISAFQLAEARRAEELREKMRLEIAKRLEEEQRAKESAYLAEMELDAKPTEAQLADAIQAEEKAKQSEELSMQALRAPVPVVERAAGMVLKDIVKWEVTDIHALYKAHPMLVRMEANRAAINATVAANSIVPGLRIWSEKAATVRT